MRNKNVTKPIIALLILLPFSDWICPYRFSTCRLVPICVRPEFYVAVIRVVANRETKVDTREAGRDSRRIPRT